MVKQNIKPNAGWRSGSLRVSSRFTNRESESEALRRSLAVHRRAIDENRIDGKTMNNILVFYGVGGVGKTTLSEHLEGWLGGRFNGSEHHWGEPPNVAGVVTVRWDLRTSTQMTSPVLFFLALRQALAAKGYRTPMFDLGFAAFHEKFNRGMSLEEARKVNLDVVQDVAANAVNDLLGLAELAGTSLGVGVGVQALSRLLTVAIQRMKVQKAAGIVDGFADILHDIRSGEDDIDHLLTAVSFVGYLLSCDIEQYAPNQRPMPVVFVDTFEHLHLPQRCLTRDEEVINSVLGNLPFGLFVVTGREMVDWADPWRTNLAFAGPATWPSLARTSGAVEPRQHLVGMLSEKDARALLTHCLAKVQAKIADHLPEQLARTARLPVHIDATIVLAERFASQYPERELTERDLGGSMPAVVERLLEHLSGASSRTLLAAAVAPSFDAELLQAIAQIDLGQAQCALRGSLFFVQPKQPYFRHHLHDEIRLLLRNAGTNVNHAWAEADWQAAAQRALDHLAERLERTKVEDLLEERMAIHVLGYRLCREYGIDSDWVVEEFAKTPSRKKVAGIIGPVEATGGRVAEAVRLNELVGATARSRLDALVVFCDEVKDEEVRHQARRWLAYTYRSLNRRAEAASLLYALWQEKGRTIDARQYVITLRQQRRYRDAVEAQKQIDPGSDLALGGIAVAEGRLTDAHAIAERRLAGAIERGASRRWIAELQTVVMSHRGWLGTVTDEELDRIQTLGETLERIDSQQTAWQWRALRRILDDRQVEQSWQELSVLTNADGLHLGATKRAFLMIAGLRALAVGDDHYLKKLQGFEVSPWGAASNIQHFLWEYLFEKGLVPEPLPLLETQWIDPVEVVRQRWRAIFDRLVDEARQRQPAVDRRCRRVSS